MRNLFFISIVTATLTGCTSVDSTTGDTVANTPATGIEVSGKTETLVVITPVSPFQAETLHNDGKYSEAFDMHHLLATRGYDWSQFNTGVSYYTGIEGKLQKDLVEAYAWMITSESIRQEQTRQEGIIILEKMLTDEQLETAEERSAVLFAQYGSGKRTRPKIQITTPAKHGEPTIVYSKQQVVAEEPERCSGVGSRIKRTCTGSHTFGTSAEFMNSPFVQ